MLVFAGAMTGAAGDEDDLFGICRQQIADGAYDTPERWDAALDKLARAMRLP